MATMRQQRQQFLQNQGFFPSEAREFSRTSRTGLRAPYFKRMIASRRRLFENAKRYKWTQKRYRDYIRKQYEDKGFVKRDSLGRYRPDFWAMVREWEERSRRRGEEYESPWEKKTQRRSGQKREVKRVTKKKALESWIKQLDRNIARSRSEQRIKKLQEQRQNLQQQLDALG